MLRSLLPKSPKTPTPLCPFSAQPKPKPKPPPFYRRRHKKPTSSSTPSPVSPSALSAAIARLPPRFTPADLTALLSSLPDPRLCLHLLSWASSRPRSLPSPAAFLTTLRKLAAARLLTDLHSAASLAFSLPLPPSEPLLNAVVYHYTHFGMLFHAVNVYKQALASPDPAARPTARTYHILFKSLLRRHHDSYINHAYMDTCRLLFRQMLESGIPPDIFTLNAMVRGYVNSLHLNDALRIFHQMEPVYQVSPNVHTYSEVIHGLSAQGRTRNARELWEEARGKGMVLTWKACNSFACALALAGEVEEAVGVVWEMGRMGRAAGEVTCRTVMEEMCRVERVGDALELLKEMADKEVLDGRTYRELRREIEENYGAG